MTLSRRSTLALVAAVAVLGTPAVQAQAKIKVAAIYTVPVEQQWVSRIDKALKAAVARGEAEYVFSENVPMPTTSG
jgi:basic membrane protein A